VSFRLRFVHGRAMHTLFRWESWLNTPLFVGFPGFVSKLWLAHDQNDVYRGVYEWDGAESAEYYARCLWRVLALVSARGSIGYAVVPGSGRDGALADLHRFAATAQELPAWACPVGVEGGAPIGARPRGRGVEGTVADGFEPVRDAFVENFAVRGELGGAVCVVVGGEVVVDLWGGVRDRTSEAPWCADTMTLVHSTTKGLSAMVLALLHSRGLLDYDERIARYWPEFAKAGKELITVRQLLSHQAGLFAFDERVDADVVADLDRLAGVMERQRPIWSPGERQAYHAITLGFYENELVRRIDPDNRTIGQMFHQEIANPLGVGDQIYIGTPSSVADERLAPLVPPKPWTRVTSMPLRLTIDAMRQGSVLHRALVANPGTSFYVDPVHVVVRTVEVPSGNAVATARAIATAYGAFAAAGGGLGLRQETIDELAAPATPARAGYLDACLGGPTKFSLGFAKPNEFLPFGSDAAFGAPGAGGSMGFADPTTRVGYGYVTDKMGTHLQGDPRDLALRHALATALAGA
jgi:CubicO group peptidase (beta-lactamase class C family)